MTIGLVDFLKDLTGWLAEGEAIAGQGYLTSEGAPCIVRAGGGTGR